MVTLQQTLLFILSKLLSLAISFMKQTLFQRVYRSLLGHPVARWIVILGSVGYLLSPMDISPDVFPVVGWIDDGVLAALLATGLTEIVLEQRRNRKAQKAESDIEENTIEATALDQSTETQG